VITTGRLLLRQLRAEDSTDVFSLRSDDRVSEFLERKKATSLDDSLKFIEKINRGVAKNEAIYWGITLKDDASEKLVGTIMLWNLSPENSSGEIGFELLPAHQGKGIMQEAITAVLNFGFDKMLLTSIEGYVHPANLKSIRILEKNGFIKEDRKAESSSEIIYSIRKVQAGND
jgi:ribosomal-protein-alanine N-acetyltransferase